MTASKLEASGSELVLMKKPAGRVGVDGAGVDGAMVREATTGRVVAMTPRVLKRVWAVGEDAGPANALRVAGAGTARPQFEVAFYRKYTEAMLRRYARLSMEAGRVPSLMGKEMFRGNVTSYRVRSFDDVVIFCADVEKCLTRLERTEKDLVRRVALQGYTQAEAALLVGLSLRGVVRQYAAAVDRLTRMFVETGMLEPLKGCQ